MLNNPRVLWLSVFIISALILGQCAPVTPAPDNTQVLEPTPELQLEIGKVGPSLVGQDPPEGQRLELSPAIKFTFDREMDQSKTADAFTLLDSNNEPVPGEKGWSNAETFSFTPDSALEPSSVYKAIFSTSATASDGESLREEIRIDFTTVDLLSVGQVFPIDRSEEIDPGTNITVIFNQ